MPSQPQCADLVDSGKMIVIVEARQRGADLRQAEASARRGLAKFAGERFITCGTYLHVEHKADGWLRIYFTMGWSLLSPLAAHPNGLLSEWKLNRFDES
jgi:hypothetical protein